jgi:hypothetical protein
MTRKKLDQGIHEGQQATAILKGIGEWISAAPGRRVTITFGADGWHVAIDDTRNTSGGSIADALAQAAQVVTFEPEVRS